MTATILTGIFIIFIIVKLMSVLLSPFPTRRSLYSGAATTAVNLEPGNEGVCIDLKDPFALEEFANTINNFLYQKDPYRNKEKIILCIGSDRCTGDCLGPLVGSSLKRGKPGDYTVYGTLQNPVHALNLERGLEKIRKIHHNPIVIAVDASLCHIQQDVGKVWINNGALSPGNAVNKRLPAVGDISVTGIVNDFQKLHSTRLYNVNKIAGFITRGLNTAFKHKFITNNKQLTGDQIKHIMSRH